MNLNTSTFTKSGKHICGFSGVAIQLEQLKQVLSSVRDSISNTRTKNDIKRQKIIKHYGEEKTNGQKRAQAKAGRTVRDTEAPLFTHSGIP